jgi:hypothetical protein
LPVSAKRRSRLTPLLILSHDYLRYRIVLLTLFRSYRVNLSLIVAQATTRKRGTRPAPLPSWSAKNTAVACVRSHPEPPSPVAPRRPLGSRRSTGTGGLAKLAEKGVLPRRRQANSKPPFRLAALARRNSLTFETSGQRRDIWRRWREGVVEHWCSADTKALRPRRALVPSASLTLPFPALPFCVRDGSPKGRDPGGARSQRSGDDSPARPFAGGRPALSSTAPAQNSPSKPETLFQIRAIRFRVWRSHGEGMRGIVRTSGLLEMKVALNLGQ